MFARGWHEREKETAPSPSPPFHSRRCSRFLIDHRHRHPPPQPRRILPGIPSVNYADFQCVQTSWNFYDCPTAGPSPPPLLPRPAPGICTTEIFEGFNFINDQAVPCATSPFGSSAAPSILPLVPTSTVFARGPFHPWTDSNGYRISRPQKGGGGWTRGTVRGGQISGRDDERSRRRRRKNFVSINNSGPVLAARESTHHLPLSVRQDSSFLLPLLRFSFLHPPCRLVRFFGEAVKEGKEGGWKGDLRT